MNPDHFEGRIVVMSVFNDIDWTGNSDVCFSNARKVSDHAKEFQRRHWSFLGLGDGENGTNVQLQTRRKMGPVSQSNDVNVFHSGVRVSV